jgi:hypothetical protein
MKNLRHILQDLGDIIIAISFKITRDSIHHLFSIMY